MAQRSRKVEVKRLKLNLGPRRFKNPSALDVGLYNYFDVPDSTVFPPGGLVMILRAKDLRKLWFEWPESLYGRFNFQLDEHIDALMELLVDNGLPAVVVLGGEPGIGRGFLCDAAAQRARDQGHKVAVWHLDLDGFEPDAKHPLTQYLRQLIDQEERQREAAREKVKGAVKSAVKTLSTLDLVGQSEALASVVSLFWHIEGPVSDLAEALSKPSHRKSAPPRDDFDALQRFLTELTRDRRLLIHVKDGPQLTSNLRRWLIGEAERAPGRLLLVISCLLNQNTEQAAPGVRKLEHFDLLPLDAAELRALLDRRFEPNEFPDDLVAVLMRRCCGRPVAIANQLADLMEAELLVYEDETWRLPPAGLKDHRLVEAFSSGLFEEVGKPLATLAEKEPELARVLRDLLSLAALCGRYVPMAALIEHLQLDEATSEAAIDWVDNVLVGELGWLTDLGFHMVGFRGHNVYTFTHPLLPQVVLDRESEVDRESKAAKLLRFLEERVHVTRRGWARCFLSIAEHLNDREREPYERLLAWWIGLEEADALQAEVRTAIELEEIRPEVVWRVAEGSKSWPAYRRLAVLEALTQATIGEGDAAMHLLPFDHLARFHLLRASLLDDVGRYREALSDALNALKLVSREPLKRAHALNLSGMARRHLGDARAARPDLEAALVLDRENLGEEHPDTLTVMNNLGVTLWSLGDLAAARQLEEQALEVRCRVLGEEHPDTLSSISNLAETLRVLGDLEGARELHDQVLKDRRRVLGEEHPDTLHSMHKLALTLRALGALEGGYQLERQALEGRRRVLGEDHPHTWKSMDNLAATLSALGDHVGSRKLHEKTLEVQERVLGGEHPDTTSSTWNLLWTVHQLNDPHAEAHLINKLRWLLDRDDNSIPSVHHREIRQKLLLFLNPT